MRSSLVAFLTIYITQIQEEHGVIPPPLSTLPKERHRLWGPRYASKVCGGPLLQQNNTYAKEHDIFRSKPNASISLGTSLSRHIINVLCLQ